MSLGNLWNALPSVATGTLRGALVVAALVVGVYPLVAARAGPAKGTPALFPFTATVDVTIPTDLVTPVGIFPFDLPDGLVATDLRVDAKGRISGGGTFRSAHLTLSGKTKRTKKGQTFSLKGTANVNGKPNTKFSTKGIFEGGALVGTTTLTDKARGISNKKAATNTLLPRGLARAFLRIRLKFEGNVTLSPTGFIDTDVGRFPLTKIKVKEKGDKGGGPDAVTVKAKGKGAKLTLKGTNDGTNFTGTASGNVGLYRFANVPLVFPTINVPRPFAQDLGANSVDVEVLPDGTLAGPVSIPLNGGVFLNFEAGAIIRTRDGKLVRGPITIEVGDGGVDGAFPGTITQEITVQVQIRLRGVAAGTPELLHASFEPPAELNVDLGDATTSFGQGIWVFKSTELPIREILSGDPLPPFLHQGSFGNLLPGGSGGGGDGDPDLRILDGNSYFEHSGTVDVDEPVCVFGTGIHTASHVPIDPAAVTPPEEDREVFFPLDPVEDLGVRVKTVTIVTVDTGQPVAYLGNSSDPGFGILDGVAVGVTADGTGIFTASVIDGDSGPEIQIDTDVKDAFVIRWTGCLPNGDPVGGAGVPPDAPPPPNEEGTPAGPFIGNIEVVFKTKRDFTGLQDVFDFRRALVDIVGPGGTVGYGTAGFSSPVGSFDSRGEDIQIPIEGYTSSTGTLGDALGLRYTFEAGHRTLCVRPVCPNLVPVVADLDDDAIVFFGDEPFGPVDRIPLPGRTGRVKAAGQRIYTTNAGRLTCVDPAGGHVVGSRKIKGLGDAMDVSPRFECIYVATERGEFIAVHPVTLRDKWKIDTLPETFLGTVDVSPDGGRAVVTAPLTGQLVFIDLLRRTVERIDAVPNAQAAVWSPDGGTVAVTDVNGGRVIFVDPDSGAQVSTSVTGQTTVQIGFAPDGSFVGVGNFNSDTFAVVNTQTGVVTHGPTVDGANGLAISPVEIDEAIRMLGSGFNDNTVNVFDVDLDEIIRTDRFQADFQPGNGAWFFDEFESFR